MQELAKTIGRRLPQKFHGELRLAWETGEALSQSARSLRRPRRGRRVVFSDSEIADLSSNLTRGPGRGEVLVRTAFSAVSPGTESSVLMGLPTVARGFPYYPGYSGSGLVASTGRGVKRFREGQPVAGKLGHSEWSVVSERDLTGFEQAGRSAEMALVELGCIVQQGIRKAKVLPGHHVAVVGAGLIGQMAAATALIAGAGMLTIVARRDRSKPYLEKSLPHHTFLATELEARGGPSHGDIAADVVIDATGNPPGLRTAIEAARAGGRVVNLGSMRLPMAPADLLAPLSARGIELVGAHISTVPDSLTGGEGWSMEMERSLFTRLVEQDIFSMPWHSILEVTDRSVVNSAYHRIVDGTGEPGATIFKW